MATLDQIQDAATAKGFFSQLMPRGYLRMQCPMHGDKNPSLMVYPRGWWKCLAEDTFGRNAALLEELENPGTMRRGVPQRMGVRAPKVPTDLDELSDLAWKAHDDLKRHPEYEWYLKMRGVEDRVDTAKLGWHEGWITVPVMSETSEVLGLYMRATPPQEKITGLRFTQPDGQRPMLYCPDWRKWQSSRTVALVFGMMDALVISSLRYPVITTTGGSSTFDPSWLDSWRKPVVIIPDGDGPDMQYAAELAGELGWRGKVLRLPYDEQVQDPADYAKEEVGRKEELRKLLAQAM
jgi:hypothetical protein